MIEEWKVYIDTCIRKDNRINGRGAIWEVSNFGNVRKNGVLINLDTEYKKDTHGYYRFGSGIPVHTAVARLFIPNPENKPEIDHIDTNILNNRSDNLRWVTHKENMNNIITKSNISKTHIGLFSGEKNPMYGKHHSSETKQKQHNSMLGKNHSTETKINISNTLKDKYTNGEIKPAKPMLGKKHSEQTKEKMRQAHQGAISYIKDKHRVYDNEEHTKWHFEY